MSILEKLNWFHLTALITLMLLMWKWMGLFIRKNHLLRWWGWLSLLYCIGVLTLSLLLKMPTRELESWFVLWSFFPLRLLCISINLPYGRPWQIAYVRTLQTRNRKFYKLVPYLIISKQARSQTQLLSFLSTSRNLKKLNIHIFNKNYLYANEYIFISWFILSRLK